MADSKGLLININKDLNAFVPNEHISDLGEKQGKAKYKVGSAVTGKVLTVDPAKKRATLTLKQALVSSKLKPLTSWEVDFPHCLTPVLSIMVLCIPGHKPFLLFQDFWHRNIVCNSSFFASVQAFVRLSIQFHCLM